MTKIEKEIIEEIFKDFNDLTIKEWIAEGIKAGRKQLAEEIWQLCLRRKVPRQAYLLWEEIEKLQKEAE